MKEVVIDSVLSRMSMHLDSFQLKQLKETLLKEFSNVDLVKKNDGGDISPILIERFISAKRVEGLSDKSLKYYENTIKRMLMEIKKDVIEINTEDLRGYLSNYQKKNFSSHTTIDNIRRILSTFFSWLEDEDYIVKSPIRRIHKIKTASYIKETYSDELLEKMRDACSNSRDLALIDILASTGMRVGELVNLNISDVDFNERECKVFGKGSKERLAYFDARTKVHLEEYLKNRKDDNDALFVTLNAPYNRLKIGGVESRVKKLGGSISEERVHPHKFRRTLATKAIDRGMPIEQLQVLLGHKRVDTTLKYAMVNQSNVKTSFRKIMG